MESLKKENVVEAQEIEKKMALGHQLDDKTVAASVATSFKNTNERS